uniref:Secreted protein n=1 Tax=Macrostomum lignano TaxID=282301 RepID=A0A1I8IMG1_9PLAT
RLGDSGVGSLAVALSDNCWPNRHSIPLGPLFLQPNCGRLSTIYKCQLHCKLRQRTRLSEDSANSTLETVIMASNCKQLFFLAVLAVGISAAVCDMGSEDGAVELCQRAPDLSPANVFCSNCLIRAWSRRNKSNRLITFHINNLNSAIQPYPKVVQDKLRALAFAATTSFENFNVQVQNSYAVKTAYIGAARKVNNIVDVAILDTDIVAALVPKYVTMSRRECKKILFWKKCKTVYFNVLRGYYASEINGMVTMLQHEAFKMFKEIVISMPA